MTTAIYQALCACFGLQPSSSDASILIREAYQDPENAPRPPRNTDVIYFSIEPDSAASEAPPEYSAETAVDASFAPVVASFAAWRLQIICYGPHALTNARQIRAFLYVDGTNMPRCILRKAGIRPIDPAPQRGKTNAPRQTGCGVHRSGGCGPDGVTVRKRCIFSIKGR